MFGRCLADIWLMLGSLIDTGDDFDQLLPISLESPEARKVFPDRYEISLLDDRRRRMPIGHQIGVKRDEAAIILRVRGLR